MIKNTFLLFTLLFFAVTVFAQQQYDSTKAEKRNYRRTSVGNWQSPVGNEQLSKKQVFPLGWNTGSLGKVTSGTGIWTELNPKVPRVDYLGVGFVNKDTGFACGDLGALIKTTDGGISWTVTETNTTTPILKVRSFNGQTVIASGFGGLVLRSTDGGESFTQITSGVTGDLWGLQMINDTLGWASGTANSLIKTTDGGITWQKILTPGYTSDYWWVDFLTEEYGFIAGNGKVLKTTDGGLSWEIIQAGDSQPLYSIDVIDSLHIAAAGYGGTDYSAKNIYSSDGGNIWINGASLTTHEINCIRYINTDTGYIVMSQIGMYKTTNRGQEWIGVTGIDDIGEYELQLFPETQVGYAAGTNVKIFKAEGSLDDWRRLIINDDFSDVFFVNEQKGFVISSAELSGNSGLYKTTDGGISWEIVAGAPNGVDIVFIDSLTGFIGASNSIYKTTDGGDSWYTTNGTTGAGKIFFINSNQGWAVHSGTIYITTDTGENWIEQITLPADHFTSIFFVDSLNGWATSRYPYKTTNSGQDWLQLTNTPILFALDVFFKDENTGFVLQSNKLFKTTDAGLNWSEIPNLTGFSLAELSYYDTNTIFIIGYKTFRSIDGGENWEEFPELNGIRVTGLSLLNAGLGYAVGEMGLILKYHDGTVPVELSSFLASFENDRIKLQWSTETETNNLGFQILRSTDLVNWDTRGFIAGNGTTTNQNTYTFYDTELSKDHYYYKLKQIDFNGGFSFSKTIEIKIPINNYTLSQNYPNPFNPVTMINFSLPVSDIIQLKVYDILGNEIKILLNEFKQAGNYEIEFNADHLTSGVYFYTIRSGSYSDTKKMVLLR